MEDLNLIDIYNALGQKIDMSALGLTGLKLHIPSPSYRTVTEEVDGKSGMVVLERVLNSRNLIGEFITKARDYTDSLIIRDKLYALLGNGQYFYVAENKNPLKRWKVYLEEWTPERLDVKHHRFQIPLFAEDGHSESIRTVTQAYTTNTFKFKNLGDLPIDPRVHMDTEISFKGVSSNLRIRNKTTNEEWSWTGTTIASDTLLLRGVRATKNEVSIFGISNRKIITFSTGWNEMEIIGASGDFELTIRSRFYFL